MPDSNAASRSTPVAPLDTPQTLGDNCASYNRQTGRVPEVALPKPSWSDRNGDTIMVDACIAATVEALWAAGHVTLSSCCGHGQGMPSLVLDNGNDVDVRGIRQMIADVDGRWFDLLQWRLVSADWPQSTDETVPIPTPLSLQFADAGDLVVELSRRGLEGFVLVRTNGMVPDDVYELDTSADGFYLNPLVLPDQPDEWSPS